ncbi:VWA domain-containing protein [Pseudodesulfovibrio sp. zrk46]|uniref:vWA domain-containing protein n=1 Tax=Pseudodesulfovibrio sp. zrk46 TaxID=2725288 RepID=UPI001449CE47|nr:VWA domain-containing protein [Pseudodesulfovibrio sp. zrk46]QJB56893.1 VWA domain-containing protein [Pseudodesulfovibrio sp. zrk46]
MKRRKSREIAGSSLAFLDVLACGLGAVVLLLTLAQEQVFGLNGEDQRLTTELAELQSRSAEVEKEIARITQSGQAVSDEIKDTSEALAVVKDKAARQSDVADTARKNKASLIEGIKKIKLNNPEDVIETPDQSGEEDYLIGLKVEGQRIAILVDCSASMTDERLIDIIRRKNSSDAEKKKGPKWRRTIRTLRWLLARLPRASMVTVIAYNETARNLGAKEWTSSVDEKGLTNILSNANEIVPTGPTNLSSALKAARELNPSDLYIITDGLPTKGDSGWGRLNVFSGCSSILGSSSKISGECRARLFEESVKKSGLSLSRKVNVILLPIEGDPYAPRYYWEWTALTGGLFIAPAQDWP